MSSSRAETRRLASAGEYALQAYSRLAESNQKHTSACAPNAVYSEEVLYPVHGAQSAASSGNCSTIGLPVRWAASKAATSRAVGRETSRPRACRRAAWGCPPKRASSVNYQLACSRAVPAVAMAHAF